MKPYILKDVKGKGKGIFATRDIKAGEQILHLDLNKLKSYSRKEINENPKLQSNHCDYYGHSRYVIDHSPASYMNHSCDPNCITKHKSIKVKDVYALKDIKKGEELTHDYAAGAIDQINAKNSWKLRCKCGSKNCRKEVTGNFFKLPVELQRKYYPYLPPSIKAKYKDRFKRLKR